MEHDPVKQAQHNASLERWGNDYGLIFTDGRAEVFGLIAPLAIDLTATKKDLWIISAVYEAFRQGVAAGENSKAVEIQKALNITARAS